MRRYILLITLIVVCIFAHGQEVNIKTIDKTYHDNYKWITFLSEGETNWDGDNGGVAYRFILTTPEIYNDIYIEKVSVGEEGGGKKIEWKRLIDRDNLTSNFKLKGEFTGVVFIKWTTWNSFELNIQGKRFLFKNLESDKIQVRELK
ncbi:MAG: hypothetical protein VB022_04195 [Rikenellaceae bacterium]|nr:hypothetical protein [Rikenellaceae bacterium]